MTVKKPILLLVDDDREVLASIEAQVERRFGEFSRVESFEDPRDVPRALSEWDAEEREIAVAVLDQKMPHQTGRDLLATLRSHPCGQRTEAILLSGYSDLGAVIEAKNEGHIARYLQKPEDMPQIAEIVGRLMRRGFVARLLSSTLMVRECRDAEEFEQHFGLRQAVYSNDDNRGSLRDPEATLDVDAFDLRAHHYGLFLHHDDVLALCGTMRTVRLPGRIEVSWTQEPRFLAFAALAQADSETHADVPSPLFLWHPENRELLIRFFERCATEGSDVAEPGRFTVRMPASSPRSLSRRGAILLAQAVTGALIEEHTVAEALISCDLHHEKFYSSFGFERLDGIEPHWVEGMGDVGTVVHARAADLNAKSRDEILGHGQRISNSLPACHCPNARLCRGQRYAEGVGADVDFFCPVRWIETFSGEGA